MCIAVQFAKRAHGIEPRTPAYGKFADHNRQSNDKYEKEIEDQERAAAASTRHVRKFPDIAETYRRAESHYRRRKSR